MPKPNNYVLVGPMGAGKSTIGRLLAQQLGFEFCDTDTLIEQRAGAEITWIFDVEGEDGFRDRETTIIEEVCGGVELVIATGGGAVMREPNRRAISGAGTVIYLYTSVEQQLHRTRRDRKRPLLQGGDREQTLRNLFNLRDPLYREVADVVVETDGRPARLVVREIRKQLEHDLD